MAAERNTSKLHDKPLNNNSTMPAPSVSSNYPCGISFSSNIAFANESDDIAYIEKRTAHNALERQRREGLNSKFQELAHVLPALQQIRRPSKSMIVAKSLEFVSNANERESDFQGQLHALRKENEQLMRQATLSKKRMKRRLEQDKTQSIKKSSLNETESKATSSKPIMAMTLRKRPASKLKPQSRKPSLLEELPLSPTKSINDSLQDKASVDEAKPNKKKRSIEQPSKESLPQKKKRERSNSHSTIQSSPSNTAIPDSTRKQPTLKSRKRNATTETYHHQAPSAIASTSNYAYYNNPATTGYSHYVEDQYLQNASINHPRYNSHQPTSGMQQETISPVVSRHNSLTMMEFNQMNDNLVIPSQFDITHSPFGERIFYNSLEPFDQPMVSLIPAVRTPIGDRNSLINTPSPVSQSYDTTLDIFNAIIIQQNQQDSSDNTNQYYEPWP